MICCFMNLHEQENSRDLVKHFDTEIEKAILFGCTKFLSGTNHPEDVIFKEGLKGLPNFTQMEKLILYPFLLRIKSLKSFLSQLPTGKYMPMTPKYPLP